jgi:hypothetical protein
VRECGRARWFAAEACRSHTAVAQQVERWSPKPEVGGSIPSRRAVFITVPSFNGQDTGLSLRRSGFDSPWHRSEVPSGRSWALQFADIAQLVERDFAMVEAAGSNPAVRFFISPFV